MHLTPLVRNAQAFGCLRNKGNDAYAGVLRPLSTKHGQELGFYYFPYYSKRRFNPGRRHLILLVIEGIKRDGEQELSTSAKLHCSWMRIEPFPAGRSIALAGHITEIMPWRSALSTGVST